MIDVSEQSQVSVKVKLPRGRVERAVYADAQLEDLDIPTFLRSLVKSGLSESAICEKYGCTKPAISSMFRRYGVKPKGCSVKGKMTEKAIELGCEDLDSFFAKNWNQTTSWMSDTLGVSHATMGRYLRDFRKRKGAQNV